MTESKKLVHEKSFNIAWGDMDALGHVNNARYFDYYQEARIEWLATLNIHLSDNSGPVVIQVSSTFLKPVIYPAHITIRSSLNTLGHSSFLMEHKVYQEELLMAEGSSKIVWVNYRENKSIRVPQIIRDFFN